MWPYAWCGVRRSLIAQGFAPLAGCATSISRGALPAQLLSCSCDVYSHTHTRCPLHMEGRVLERLCQVISNPLPHASQLGSDGVAAFAPALAGNRTISVLKLRQVRC